jgi:hypothetical protein
VGDDQGQGVGLGGAGLDEVDVESVDHLDEVVEAVEGRLPGSPVVAAGPVAAHLLDVAQRYPLAPVVYRLPIGPAGAVEAADEVGEIIV